MGASNAGSDGSTVFGVERSDLLLACSGGLLALGLTIVAGAMIARDSRTPLVNGAEHLNLFARPALIHEERREALAGPSSAPTGEVASKTIDYAPTATIGAKGIEDSARPPVPSGPGAIPGTSYTLVGAAPDRATFRGPRGDLVVRRGSVVPGLGRVEAIARQGGAWTVTLTGPAAR